MMNIETKNILNFEETFTKKYIEKYLYPWEIVPNISDIFSKLILDINTEEYIVSENNVFIHKSATVSPLACIESSVIIGSNTIVKPFAYIRNNVIIGNNCVIGNSTEIKNSILFNDVKLPHYNYVGDSILSYSVHLGAGTIISNYKSDKSLINIKINDSVIKTELNKLGAIIGDNVEIGCNAVITPGTIIGANTIVYPLSLIRGYIKENIIYKNKNEIIDRK